MTVQRFSSQTNIFQIKCAVQIIGIFYFDDEYIYE